MLRELAKILRYRQTDAEERLWLFVRNRQLKGCKFRRQYPIDTYIVDFVCIAKKLVIELDGGMHIKQIAKDAVRMQYLRNLGFVVLRYRNEDVLSNVNHVLQDIEKNIEGKTPHSSLSPKRGERIR